MTAPTPAERRARLERMRAEYLALDCTSIPAWLSVLGQEDVERALKMLDEEEGR